MLNFRENTIFTKILIVAIFHFHENYNFAENSKMAPKIINIPYARATFSPGGGK
jgi:hypothetical protein